jgi:hypothetical protein
MMAVLYTDSFNDLQFAVNFQWEIKPIGAVADFYLLE